MCDESTDLLVVKRAASIHPVVLVSFVVFQTKEKRVYVSSRARLDDIHKRETSIDIYICTHPSTSIH
jgi:hypothetical protein